MKNYRNWLRKYSADRAYIKHLVKLPRSTQIRTLGRTLDLNKTKVLFSFLKKVCAGLKKNTASGCAKKLFCGFGARAKKKARAYKKKLFWFHQKKLKSSDHYKLYRKFKSQKGGFWSTLLATLIPIAFELVYKELVP